LEHAFLSATNGVDLDRDVVGASQSLDKLLSIISAAPIGIAGADDPYQLRIERTIARLADQFHVPETEIRKRLATWKERKKSTPQYDTIRDETASPTENSQAESRRKAETFFWTQSEYAPDALERELIELWFADPQTFFELEDLIPDEWLISPVTKTIQAEWRKHVQDEGTCSFTKLLTQFDDPIIKNCLVEIDESAAEKGINAEMDSEKRDRLVTEIVQAFSRREIKRKTPKDIGSLKSDSLSREEKLRTLEEIRKRKK
ncbi:MAG: hypothetical protein ACRC2T_05470, partial [Thermoguttaceae bacterium]